MITSFNEERLSRDLDQTGQWAATFLGNMPEEFTQDLAVQEAIAQIFSSISVLRTKLENAARTSERSVLGNTRAR